VGCVGSFCNNVNILAIDHVKNKDFILAICKPLYLNLLQDCEKGKLGNNKSNDIVMWKTCTFVLCITCNTLFCTL